MLEVPTKISQRNDPHLQDDGGEHNTTTGFGATQQEINVVLDLLDNNIWLFEVKKRNFLIIELFCNIKFCTPRRHNTLHDMKFREQTT